jgi:hypothetical protein
VERIANAVWWRLLHNTGLIAIIWGFFTNRRGGRKLLIVGAAGIICLTIIPYSALYYFGYVQRGGIYDDLRVKLAQTELNSLVQTIEFYKLAHGEYPESLEILKSSLSKDSLVAVNDPRLVRNKTENKNFYYRKVDSGHYYLRGVAPDGMPFSPGALVPQLGESTTQLGLLIAPPPTQAPSSP